MTRREQILAGAVGLLILSAVLFYGTKRVANIFISRSDAIAELNGEIEGKELMVRRGVEAEKILEAYASRALPGKKQIANSRYRAWLHEWCSASRITRANVKFQSTQRVMIGEEHVHDKHTFSVIFQAGLPQLVNLLYDFYSQDYLHRIKTMKAVPIEKQKTLMISMQVEAVALPEVEDRELVDMPSERLALGSIEEYLDVIAGRNPYSPGNKPPKFASTRTQSGFVDQRMSFSPEVDDPDNDDITYRVEHDGLEGLEIDERTGRVQWVPQEVGEFEILVYATDDGLPAKEVSQKITLAVANPPPPEPEPEDEGPPPPPSFDEAKYTFVTGIVEVNGRRQVWLTVRTEGKWLKLFEGDTFEIGSMEGKIVRIFPRHVEIMAESAVFSVRFGQSLNDGELLTRSDEDVAAATR